MNKKYNIINSKSCNVSIDHFFYIIILLLIIYLVYLIIFNNNLKINESFSDVLLISPEKIETKKEIAPTPLTSEQLIVNLKVENEELITLKNKLGSLLEEQSRGLYLSSNYNKVDVNSFNDELDYVNTYFNDTKLPEINISSYNVINNEQKLNTLLNEAKTFKNIYAPGEKVLKSSNFNITKDDICYNRYKGKLAGDKNFIVNYPDCMVCSVNDTNSYEHDNSWKNTKTNIKEVCLYNPTAETNSGILNYDGCKKICNVA